MSIAKYIAAQTEGALPYRNLGDQTGILNFSGGDPDLDTPSNVSEASDRAIRAGMTHYAPPIGLLELRQAISRRYKRLYDVAIDPDCVQITTGGANALFVALFSLIQPGDRVVMLRPSLEFFNKQVAMAGGVPVDCDMVRVGNELLLDLDALRNVAKGAKVLVCNFPNNPSGAVISASAMAAIAQVAAENDLTVVSDEVYDQLLFDGHQPQSMVQHGIEKLMVINSFSKTYAMTGWRLGYIVASKSFMGRLTQLFTFAVAHGTTSVQLAGVEALDGPQDWIDWMIGEMKSRRDAFFLGLDGIKGLSPLKPSAALYVLCDVSGTGMNGLQFSDHALEQQKVYCYPGSAFGSTWRNYVRFSYAGAPQEVCSEAVNRLAIMLGRKV